MFAALLQQMSPKPQLSVLIFFSPSPIAGLFISPKYHCDKENDCFKRYLILKHVEHLTNSPSLPEYADSFTETEGSQVCNSIYDSWSNIKPLTENLITHTFFFKEWCQKKYFNLGNGWWVDRWMDGWILDRWTVHEKCMDVWWINKWMNERWIDVWTDEWMDERTDNRGIDK